jgi:hypothetical protein
MSGNAPPHTNELHQETPQDWMENMFDMQQESVGMTSNLQDIPDALAGNIAWEEFATPLEEYLLSTIAHELGEIEAFPPDLDPDNDPEYQLVDYFMALVHNVSKALILAERLIVHNENRWTAPWSHEHVNLASDTKGTVPYKAQDCIRRLLLLRTELRRHDDQGTSYNDDAFSRARRNWTNRWWEAKTSLAIGIPVAEEDRKGYAELILNAVIKNRWRDELAEMRRKEEELGAQNGAQDAAE